MKKNTLFSVSAKLSLLVLLTFACTKMELDKVSSSGEWNPNLAAPIGFAEFGVYDILARTDTTDLIVIDPETGKMALVYDGELLSLRANEFFELKSFSEEFVLDLSDFDVPPQASYSGEETYESDLSFTFYEGDDIEVKEVHFREGMLKLRITSDFKHEFQAEVEMPTFVENGNPVSFTLTVPPANGGASFSESETNLSEVIADFSLGGTTVNTFETSNTITIKGTGEEITGNEELKVEFEIVNPRFDFVNGYFGQASVSTQDSILLKIFENMSDGHFEFTDPKFKLDITSSIGVPFAFTVNDLRTIIIETGEELELIGFPTVFNIDAPSSPGEEVTSRIQFDNTNTDNIETIISPTPQYFFYNVGLGSNPEGKTSTPNFLSYNSSVSLHGEVELPLEGFAYGFEIRDTVPFEYTEDFSDADDFESVMFRLIFDNGFPVDLYGQARFMDADYNVLFSAFEGDEENIVASGRISDGKVVEKTREISDIKLDNEKIELLNQIRYVELFGSGETNKGTEEKVVKIFDSYTIFTKLSIQVKTKQSF